MTDTELGLQRLDNWARWACGGECAMILQLWYPKRAAVAGQHLSSEVWDDEPARMPVNVKDAEIVEKLIIGLVPYLRNAVRHTYTGRPRMINTHDKIIREWVEQAAREIMIKKFHDIT
jgi:hypothetical protein